MPSSGISPLQQRRYGVLRQKKPTILNYFLLGGVMIVLAFCATFLMLRFVSGGLQGTTSILKDDLNSRRKSHTELLSGQCPAICYSKECLRTAAQILEMLDPTIDPCEDFSFYACGRYNRIPTEHDSKMIYLWFTEDEAVEVFRDLIKGIPNTVPINTLGSSLSKLRKFYDSCMDITALEENAIPTALKYLENFGIKPWPELGSDFIFSDPVLDEVLFRMAFYKQHPFFKVDVRYTFLPFNKTGATFTTGFKGDRELKIMMSSKSRPIFHTKRNVEDDKMLLIKNVLEYVVPNATLGKEILEDVLSFDLALYDIIQKADERDKDCRRNSTTGDCSTTLSYDCREGGNQHMDRWCKITKEILDHSGFSKKNSSIPVLLSDQEYFQDLELLMDSTNQRTIARTMALQFFTENAVFMNAGLSRKANLSNEDANSIRKRYLDKLPELRSQFCTVWACYRLPILAEAAFYVGRSNTTELRKEANEIFSYVREASIASVRKMTWLDADIKEALENVHAKMSFYPETYLSFVSDLSKVDALHEEVEISEETFLANELESRKHGTTFYLKSMDDPEATSVYYAIPYQFEAYFDDSVPAVGMELGNLVFPDFTIGRPRYANFAFIGYVIGHEIGHGIGIELYPPFGMNKSEIFGDVLGEKEECLANHYSQYEVYNTGVKVKGKHTFHENMADYFGIRSAFESFKKYQETHGEEQMLPGLHFSNEQIFFILNAQNWCATHTPEAVKKYFQDSHSPPNVRILGMNKNYDAFSEAFSCGPGTPMNPISKCQI